MTRYILLDIHLFWEDTNEPPSTLVGVYDTLDEAFRAALYHYREGDDGDTEDTAEPDDEPVLDLGAVDGLGNYCICHSLDNAMMYQLLRWEPTVPGSNG